MEIQIKFWLHIRGWETQKLKPPLSVAFVVWRCDYPSIFSISNAVGSPYFSIMYSLIDTFSLPL